MDTEDRGQMATLPATSQPRVPGLQNHISAAHEIGRDGPAGSLRLSRRSGTRPGRRIGFQRETAVLQAIREVTQVILSEPDLCSLIQSVCKALTRRRGYRSAWIVILDDNGGVQEYAASGNEEEADKLASLIGKGGLPYCISTSMILREPVFCHDDADSCESCPLSRHCPSGGGVCVPIFCSGGVCGFLTVFSDAAAVQSADEQHLLRETADNLGLALRRIRADRKRAEAERALREHQRLLATLMSNLPGMVYRCQNDPNWTVEFASDGSLELTGYAPEELIGSKVASYASLIHPEDRDLVWKGVQHALSERRGFQLTYRIRKSGGDIRWVWEQGCGVYTDDGSLLALEGFISDITAFKRSEDELRESKERYELAARGSNDGLWDWDVRGDRFFMSARWRQMMGMGDSSFCGTLSDWTDRVHPDDFLILRQELDSHLSGDSPQFRCEYRIQHADGIYRWMLCRGVAVRDENDVAYRVAGSQTDITDRRRAEDRLKHDALHDPLTGLANRSYFLNRLRRLLERARRQPESAFAVLFLDFDEFKKVNDTHGHLVGDEVLINLARRIETCVRPGDMVARQGGDEFTILLQAINEIEDATLIAERVRQELMEPCIVMDRPIMLSASIGIAIGGANYSAAEDIVHDADIAMYRSKSRLRSVRETARRRKGAAAPARDIIEADLPHALERRELQIHYQPLVSLTSDRIAGFESLLRWRHPTLGQVTPGAFLPTASRSGLIVPIGRWALCEAWQSISEVQKAGGALDPLVLCVNISAPELAHPELLELIALILEGSESEPNRPHLHLELSREALAVQDESTVTRLAALHPLSIDLQITDPAESQEAARLLPHLPIRTIRLHRSYAERTPLSSDTGDSLRLLVSEAHERGCEIVAEGIETAEQADLFREAGCDWGQGYYYGAPVGREVLADLILRSEIRM